MTDTIVFVLMQAALMGWLYGGTAYLLVSNLLQKEKLPVGRSFALAILCLLLLTWTLLCFLPELHGSLLGAGVFVLLGAALACYHKQDGKAAVEVTRVVGITGTIASGKSLVGKLLEEVSIPVFDTDHIAHYVQAHDQEVQEALRKRFGGDVFKSSGELDRKKLGRIVFDDAAALKDLNAIVHPATIRECRKRIAAKSGAPLVAVLVPLLFEAGLEKEYDEIWTVTASDEVVRERLKARDGISDEDADKRIKAQFPQKTKVERSHYVIDNSGTVDDTRRQLVDLLKKLGFLK